ncbi:MAG: hypothetical protein IJ083_16695, partial [Clostridia bacterium]|nr:hypothetical protein [Clostridia bacterium]
LLVLRSGIVAGNLPRAALGWIIASPGEFTRNCEGFQPGWCGVKEYEVHHAQYISVQRQEKGKWIRKRSAKGCRMDVKYTTTGPMTGTMKEKRLLKYRSSHLQRRFRALTVAASSGSRGDDIHDLLLSCKGVRCDTGK